MRFNSEAYDKIFPREKPVEQVETMAEKFTPTEDEQVEKKSETNEEIYVEEQEGDFDGDRRSDDPASE